MVPPDRKPLTDEDIDAGVAKMVGFAAARVASVALFVLAILAGLAVGGFTKNGWAGLLVGGIIATVAWLVSSFFRIVALIKRRPFSRQRFLNAVLAGTPVFGALVAALTKSVGYGIGAFAAITTATIGLMIINAVVRVLAARDDDSTAVDQPAPVGDVGLTDGDQPGIWPPDTEVRPAPPSGTIWPPHGPATLDDERRPRR